MTQCIAKPLPPHVQGVFNVICPLSHWSALVFSTTNHAHNHYSLQITVTCQVAVHEKVIFQYSVLYYDKYIHLSDNKYIARFLKYTPT